MKPVDAVAAVLPTVAVIALLCWLGTQLWPILRMWRMAKKIPGPTAWPLMGNGFDFIFRKRETNFNSTMKMFRVHGSVFRLWFGPKLVIAVASPVAAQRILTHPKVINRDHHFNMALDAVIADSLFTVKEDKFKKHRKVLDGVFHPMMLESYLPAIGEHSDRLADVLSTMADGRTIDIKDYLTKFAIRLVFDTFIGVANMQIDEHKCLETGSVIDFVLLHCYVRITQPWLLLSWLAPFTSQGRQINAIHKQLNSVSDSVLAAKKSALAQDGGATKSIVTAGNNVVQNLMDMVFDAAARGQHLLDEAVVKADLCTFLAAGVDTSVCTMAYVLMMLGMRPKYQQRVFEEQKMIFAESLRPATVEDISKMVELDLVIKETLRLYPPASLLPREIPEDIEISEGVVLPAGCSAYIFTHSIHRDPDNFVQPDSFWPERWLPENSAGRHPFAYLPFSAGVRRCIGQRYAQLAMKCTLSRVLRQFRFESRYKMAELERIKIGMTNTSVLGYNVQIFTRT